MNNRMPLVSVITPMFNSARFLESAVNSVIDQTYRNWELILIDDASTDNSFEIASFLSKEDPRIKCFRMPENLGAAAARNEGLKLARGRFIAFIDSDDVWLPEKLEKQIQFMLTNSLVFTYCGYYVINEQGQRVAVFDVPSKLTYKKLLYSNSIGNLTAIYDAAFFGKVLLATIKHEDYILWLKLLKKIPYTLGIREQLAEYRKYNDSYSANKWKALTWQWNIYRKVEKLGLMKSLFLMCSYGYHGLTKYKKFSAA